MDEDAQARPWTEEEITRLIWLLVDMVRLTNDERRCEEAGRVEEGGQGRIAAMDDKTGRDRVNVYRWVLADMVVVYEEAIRTLELAAASAKLAAGKADREPPPLDPSSRKTPLDQRRVAWRFRQDSGKPWQFTDAYIDVPAATYYQALYVVDDENFKSGISTGGER